ncbi:MAG: metal-sensitive transcriptional regulator [Anaerolineae bacterium]|nr:metal-sensitive transcriptional regulator [Anaerolineae bacterium]
MNEQLEHARPHQHDESLRRLRTAEGHLRGIQRMLEDDAYCIDIIRQIQAVQAALNKVSMNILDQHLNSCVITAVQGEDQSERERVLKEITEVFAASRKV